MSLRTATATLLCLLATLSILDEAAHAYPAVHMWSKRFGSNQNSEQVQAVATDQSGNVILVGQFLGSIDFGAGTITGAGFTDGCIAKFDGSGNLLWGKRMSGADSDWLAHVAVDASGNIYVTGTFNSTVDFGNGPLVSAGVTDISVAKLTPGGGVAWSKRFGSTGDDWGQAITVDGNGNIFVTGFFSNTVNFGGANLVSAGSNDVFVLKLDANGTHAASARYGGTSGDRAYRIDAASSGNITLTGNFFNSVSFGGATLNSAGNSDIFLVQLDNNLGHVWSKRFGGTANDQSLGVAVAGNGDVYFTGTFQNSVDFGGGPLPAASVDKIVIAKYTAAGAHVWSKAFGSATNGSFPWDINIDIKGRPFVTGYFSGSIDFGGGAFAAVNNDMFVAHFDAAGTHLWSASFGNALGAGGKGVATDLAGDVFVGGYFYNTVDFGGGPLTSLGGPDLFLAKFTGPSAEPQITSLVDIPNDQGRKVRIRFDRSGWDGVSATPITNYEAYRMEAPGPSASAGAVRAPGWTFVGSVPAHGEVAYSMDVATIGDSTISLGAYPSAFYVRAATSSSTAFYDSPPFFGSSIDNLAPAVPSNFVYAAGNLTWHDPVDDDFDYFTVYGSNVDSFGAATLVNYSITAVMNVTSSPYTYYYVTATDFSGNEGLPAKVNTLSNAGGTPASYVLSVSNYPNPFNPRTTVSYTLPARGQVVVRIYDARGGFVVTLVQGERAAGAYSTEWNGRDAAGASVSSGVYFARIEHNGTTRTKKMVLLK